MIKGEAWRKWWHEKHGKNMPMGGYHPMEGAMYDAWSAGWDTAIVNTKNYSVQEMPNTPICQQCRVKPAEHKVPTMKGDGFRWKCEICFKKTGTSGFKDKSV